MNFEELAIEAKTVVCRRECRMLNEATNSVEAATHGDRGSRFRGDLSLLTWKRLGSSRGDPLCRLLPWLLTAAVERWKSLRRSCSSVSGRPRSEHCLEGTMTDGGGIERLVRREKSRCGFASS